MGVKSNIPSLALRKLNELYWGIRNTVNTKIYENYIEYLGCDSINSYGCGDVPCDNPTIVFTCTLSLRKMTDTVVGNNVNFSILDADIANGLKPYTFKWEYDPATFDIVAGDINSESISLSLKSPKILGLIVSRISLDIIDANNCKSKKVCFITPSGMQCNNYTPCPPATDLTITKIIRPISVYYGYKDNTDTLSTDEILASTKATFNPSDPILADYTSNSLPKILWVAIPKNTLINSWFVTDINKGTFGQNQLFSMPIEVGEYNFYVTNYKTAQTQLPFKFLS